MLRCLGLSLLVAAPLACFSEPPSTSTSSDGAATSSTSAAGDETGRAETGSAATTEPSGTSVGSTDSTVPPEETGDASTEGSTGDSETSGTSGAENVVYDLYERACDDAQWEAADARSGPSAAPCYEEAVPPATGGAVRKVSDRRLILEPPVGDAPFLSGTYSLPDVVASQGNARLRFDLMCVNPVTNECDVGFVQVLVYPPTGADPRSIPFEESTTFGPAISVDVPIEFGGPGDELVIALLADNGILGQAVQLQNPRIVTEG